MASEPGKAKGSLAKDKDEAFSPPMIHLTHEHMKKFGIKQMPKVGSKIKISGLVHVGSTSEHDGSHSFGEPGAEGEGPSHSMTLHLHKMEMGKDTAGEQVAQEAETAKGAKAEMDKALERAEGGSKSRNSEGSQSRLGRSDNTPRGTNGPGARA